MNLRKPSRFGVTTMIHNLDFSREHKQKNGKFHENPFSSTFHNEETNPDEISIDFTSGKAKLTKIDDHACTIFAIYMNENMKFLQRNLSSSGWMEISWFSPTPVIALKLPQKIGNQIFYWKPIHIEIETLIQTIPISKKNSQKSSKSKRGKWKKQNQWLEIKSQERRIKPEKEEKNTKVTVQRSERKAKKAASLFLSMAPENRSQPETQKSPSYLEREREREKAKPKGDSWSGHVKSKQSSVRFPLRRRRLREVRGRGEREGKCDTCVKTVVHWRRRKRVKRQAGNIDQWRGIFWLVNLKLYRGLKWY